MTTNETHCPNCGRHCSRDDLHCPRGRAYFGVEEPERKYEMRHSFDENAAATVDDKIARLMRAVGHQLHHGGDSSKLTSKLEESEKYILAGLLKKCLKGMEE